MFTTSRTVFQVIPPSIACYYLGHFVSWSTATALYSSHVESTVTSPLIVAQQNVLLELAILPTTLLSNGMKLVVIVLCRFKSYVVRSLPVSVIRPLTQLHAACRSLVRTVALIHHGMMYDEELS